MKFRYKEFVQIPRKDWEYFKNNMELPFSLWITPWRGGTNIHEDDKKQRLKEIRQKDYKIVKL